MDKKTQIQMGETIAVLFVFFVLILIGLIFYVRIIKGNIEGEKDEASQLRAIGIAQRAMFLPELQCSEDNIIRDNCIDIWKLESAENLMKNNEIYYDLLEFSNVNVSQIYPAKQEWNIYSRKIENTNRFVTNVPISLYNPNTRKYGFGVLTIETYSK